MSQLNDELPFFDYIMEDSEHLIGDGGFRVGEQEWLQSSRPADESGSAFTYTATHISGPQSSGVFSGVAATYSAVSAGLSSATPIFDKLSPTNDSLYSGGSSPAVSAHSNIALYEFAPQQNSPNPYLGSNYVSPMALQDSSSSGMELYPWVNACAGNMGDTLPLSNVETMTLPSPATAFDSLAGGLDAFTDPELGAGMQQGFQLQYQSGNTDSSDMGAQRNKRAKTSLEQDVTAARNLSSTYGRPLLSASPVAGLSNAGGSAGQGKTKLRSASRTSKNVANRPEETVDERRTRNAHNLIEKQYRNRLSLYFEGLLNALPESLRLPGGVGGPNDSDPNLDLGERRLSKGDVLELSTRYIRMLEKDCKRLEQERDDLTRDIERLRNMYINQGMPDQSSKRPGGDGSG